MALNFGIVWPPPACQGLSVKTTTTKGEKGIRLIPSTWSMNNPFGYFVTKGWLSSCELTVLEHHLDEGSQSFHLVPSYFFFKPCTLGGGLKVEMYRHQMQHQRSQQSLRAGPLTSEVSRKAIHFSDLESRRHKTGFGGRRNGEEAGLVVAAVRAAEETR